MTSLLVDVVRREPLVAADGRSGSRLERVVLAGGEALVVKHVRAGGDWIMRASHDRGRAVELWSSGVLARVPAAIDHTVLGAERDGDGATGSSPRPRPGGRPAATTRSPS